MLPTDRDAGQTPILGQTYAELTVQWVRQTRAYARSLQAYQQRAHTRRRRPDPRPAQLAVTSPPVSADSAPPDARLESVHDQVIVESVPSTAPAPRSTAPLTRRQFEVAQLIARGLSNEEIARELVLSPGTVGNHIGHILRRLGARNRAQVAAWVTQIVTRDGGGDPRGSLAP